ncbi:hydroxycarboxylic acid receptor 2 [Xenopus tropicalis]|uniref:Hydroxycarboxylic acid receptor 2 n=1 Tax=Xenopus tropicalis TaxID=8364 RepID=A0A8J0QUW6_XENTR|nr:hydroxycarboxylic acid receptor 2 [Xenopus tropicalis]
MTNTTCCNFEVRFLSYLLPPVLILVFVLGSLFNGLSLWIFCFHNKSWKASTVWLFNLALADFLLMVCLPFRTDYYLRHKHWQYGDIPCRLVLFVLSMSRSGSIFFLTLVATDRYFRVVHPHHRINSVSTMCAAGIACVVWLITIAGSVFILTKRREFSGGSEGLLACESFAICLDYSEKQHDYIYLVQFFVPLATVAFCSCRVILRLRQRNLDRHAKIKRAVQCMVLVGMAFCFCFLPSVSTRIEMLRLLDSPQWQDCNIYRGADTAFYISICLTYMNSMCNPLLYYFSSPSFQAFYLKIAKCPNQAASESETNDQVANTYQTNEQLQQ